ncbi:MAG: hypothetical protein IPL24_08150 [Bacteroidetes bacterium]|nr:hypothetical protein [Bacteroidota bacterium]
MNSFAAVSTPVKRSLSRCRKKSILLILSGALIYGFARYRFIKRILIYGLIVLIAIDLIGVDRRYVDSDSFVKNQ